MADDFACHSVQSVLSQKEQISGGRCKSAVLSITVSIRVPLVVRAFTTFSMTMMIKDIALYLIAWFLNVSQAFLQVFNQRNISFFQCLGKSLVLDA